MGIAERKGREKAERETLIVATARQIAEAEGWEAVTIRRLAREIEYSQPVLYAHFSNRDDIVAAVALQGFSELAAQLGEAVAKAASPQDALLRTSATYLDFALSRPALYEAMFVLPTGLLFGDAETRQELRAGFDAITVAVAPFCDHAEVVAETLWAALHGLAELERSNRIRPDLRDHRIMLVAQAIVAAKA